MKQLTDLQRYRSRQSKLKRKPRQYYVTDKEHVSLKNKLKDLRKGTD